jgi:UPF0042 nucleotide-binding protein
VTPPTRPKRILLVTGMAGAGKTTALKTFEDLGWEVVDNLPLSLLDRLLGTPPSEGSAEEDRSLALGIDSRTRDFDAARIVRRVQKLREHGDDIAILYLDSTDAELARRFSETRRRHPLAADRPAADGIARERMMSSPLREAADHVLDTTETTTNALQQELRARFGGEATDAPVLTLMSFGYARGLPRNADLVFDMRFLKNPHWVPELKPLTGLDDAVGDHIREDSAYEEALTRIEELILMLLPRYALEGKSYVTIGFGCTGGRHRSVHVTERVARRLREAAFSPTVVHRDLASRPQDAMEGKPKASAERKKVG